MKIGLNMKGSEDIYIRACNTIWYIYCQQFTCFLTAGPIFSFRSLKMRFSESFFIIFSASSWVSNVTKPYLQLEIQLQVIMKLLGYYFIQLLFSVSQSTFVHTGKFRSKLVNFYNTSYIITFNNSMLAGLRICYKFF